MLLFTLMIKLVALLRHNVAVNKVMERAQQYNIKFNPNNVQVCLPEVKFFGSLFNKNGIRPDADTIKAITGKSITSNKKIIKVFQYLPAPTMLISDQLSRNSLKFDGNSMLLKVFIA